MAFQAPSDGQVRENRKILEQLEEQKRKLRMQTQVTPGANINQSAGPTAKPMMSAQDLQQMTPAQRAALQHAHQNSVGYFITQESSFGNLILPVIPRYDKPAA